MSHLHRVTPHLLLACLASALLLACDDDGPSAPEPAGLDWQIHDVANSGLPTDWTHRIVFDRKGVTWVATFDRGVARFDGTHWTVIDSGSGLPSSSVRDLAVDADDCLWVATGAGLAYGCDGGDWRVFDTSNAPLPVDHVAAVAVDAAGRVWVGSGDVSTGGLFVYDGLAWQSFTPADSPLPCSIVETIQVADDGAIWIGTSQCIGGVGGLVHLADDIWTVYHMDVSPLPYNAVESLAFDGDGGVWAGQRASFYADPDILHGALLHFDGARWTSHPPAASGRTSNRVTAVAADDRGLWVATSPDGAYNYELSRLVDGRWETMADLAPGFPHAFIQDLTVDERGRVWAASDQGVIVVSSD